MTPAPRYAVGDQVFILRAPRLIGGGQEVVGRGEILRVTEGVSEPLYWVKGFTVARTANQLRPAAPHKAAAE
jgi:hypothetical protein